MSTKHIKDTNFIAFPSNLNSGCLHELFEYWAKQTPNAPALVFEGQQLTYDELDRRANQLANYLQKSGVKAETVVGICIDRSIEMVIGVLGVLKAGGAYLPLDPTYPAERLAFMIEDARIPLLLTQKQFINTLPLQENSLLSSADSRPSEIRNPKSEINNPQVICLDSDWKTIAAESQEKPAINITADNLAYVIYTSGSTGKPKGVAVTHRGLGNVSAAQIEMFGVGPGSRVLQFSSLSFDASVFEIVMAFGSGAALYLGTAERLLPGTNLLRFLRDYAISIVTLPPSALAQLPFEELPDLKTITVAGEACPVDLANRWGKRHQFFNLYGPTEATIWATAAECNGNLEKMHIGCPIQNTQIYLLDNDLKPTLPGPPGEMYIAGIGLARGYLDRPKLTEERFINYPLGDEVGEMIDLTSGSSPKRRREVVRLYKTGDLARRLPNGNIEFLGRADHQVKIRGYRIELEEIEATLCQHPRVKQAVVVAQKIQSDSLTKEISGVSTVSKRPLSNSDQQLVAYLVASDAAKLTSMKLREFLKETLPDYMVPTIFMVLDVLPLTPNGKIDRKALPAPAKSRPETIFVAPRNSIEKTVVTIWKDVLGLEQTGIHDNFFELGGHSLSVATVIARVQEIFNVELPFRSLFEKPTIAEIVRLIETLKKQKTGKSQIPILERIKTAFPTDRKGIFEHYLQQEIARILDVSVEQLSRNNSLIRHNLGAGVTDLVRILKRDLHIHFFPPELLAFQSIAGLADFILAELERQENLPAFATDNPLLSCHLELRPLYNPDCYLPAEKTKHDDSTAHSLLQKPASSPAGEPLSSMVFIHSAPRTGSTLLRVMLGGHPNLFCPPELNLLFYRDMQQWQQDLGIGSNYQWPAFGLHAAFCELEELTPKQGWERVDKLIAKNQPVREVYSRLQQLAGKRTLVDKTVPYALNMNTLERTETLFKNPKHVYITRHPYSVIESCLRMRIDKLLNPARFEKPDIDPYAVAEFIWKRFNENINRFLEQVDSERWKIVQYETLVNDPANAMAGICEFLEIPFDEAVLNPYDGRRERMISAFGDPNILEHTAIDPNLANIWQKIRLPRQLDNTTYDLASRLGYELPKNNNSSAPRFSGVSITGNSSLNDAGLNSSTTIQGTKRAVLSFAQERLWFLDQLEPGNPAYNMPIAFRLTGIPDIESLNKTFNTLIRRHEVLRTVFVSENGRPQQIIQPKMLLNLIIVDLSQGTGGNREVDAAKIILEETQHPFDLVKGPLFRAMLLHLDKQQHIFLLTLHHIISDGWSIDILLQEVATLYTAFCNPGSNQETRETLLPKLSLQYAGFASWQRSRVNSKRLEADLLYWREKLKDAPPALALQSDHPRPANPSYRGARQAFVLPEPLTRSLKEFGQAQRATLFMVLLTAFYILLYRFSQQKDIVVGSPIANRNRPELDGIIGLFANALVLRCQLSGNLTFKTLLAKVKETCLEAYTHQDLPFEKLVETLQPERDMSRQPLFQVVFALQNAAISHLKLPGLSTTRFDIDNGTAKHDLMLSMTEQQSTLNGLLEYSTDLFESKTANRMLESLKSLLAEIVANPLQSIDSLLSFKGVENQQPPLTANRKNPNPVVTFQPPRTPIEQVIASVWREVLNAERIGIYDNFFELGGHSLLATQIISYLSDIFQVELPLSALFDGPTIAKLNTCIIDLCDKEKIAEEIARAFLEIETLSEEETVGIQDEE